MSEYTTRQILDMIEANGGPEGLDLSEKDLREIDLSRDTIQAELVRVRRVKSGIAPTWVSTLTHGIDLKKVNLQKSKLARANLQGADLSVVNLQGPDLRGANLQGAHLKAADISPAFPAEDNLYGGYSQRANLQGAVLWGANLQEAKLVQANLRDADLRVAVLRGAELSGADLRGAELGSADLKEADLRGANLTQVSLLDAKSIEAISLYRATLDHTQLAKDRLGGAIGEELRREWFQAKEAYLELKNNFEQIGRYDDASWAYCKERRMEKATKAPWRCREYYGQEEPFPRSIRGLFSKLWPNLRQYGRLPRWSPLVWWFWLKYTVKWLGDWFVELLCGYGESIRRVLFWMAAKILGFAAYYWHIDGVWLVEPSGEAKIATSVWHYLIYSAGAFTTTQFARFQAADDRVRMVTAIQAIIGIVLAGLLGFVAGNRIRRS